MSRMPVWGWGVIALAVVGAVGTGAYFAVRKASADVSQGLVEGAGATAGAVLRSGLDAVTRGAAAGVAPTVTTTPYVRDEGGV